jgi:arylsulfatase A-like enzyme
MKLIDRRTFNRGALGSLLLSAGNSRAGTPPRRPNVLFVMSDEWRAQAAGYMGDPNAQTPAIDHFAGQSINFQQAIAGCSVCCPARASLMTGQYPLTNGVYINDVPLEPRGITLGESFRQAGYRTGYIGKWHLYGSPDGRNGRRQDYIPPAKRFGFEYWKAGECSHDYNHSLYYSGDDTTKQFWPGYDAQAQTDDACRYVQERSREADPYFLVLSWGPPHFPLHTAPEIYQARYRDREILLRSNVPESHRAKAIESLRGYYAHIAALDDCFKRLLDALEATGTADDTIVVWTSDHGDMMESQGLSYKLYPWEESIRVPLLIRYPRKFGRTGRSATALVNSPDIMPTLLGLSGVPIPAGVQGTDYSQLRAAPHATTPSASAFLSMPVPLSNARSDGIAEYRGVRNTQYTYVRSIQGPWLLYDNRRDPFQMHNLCGQPRSRAIQSALDTQLNVWLRRLEDKFLPAADYLQRDHLAQYVETRFPIGHAVSPWNDWESTLAKPVGPLSIDSAFGELLDNPAARQIVATELPELLALADNPNVDGIRAVSLRLIQQLGFRRITAAQLQSINEQLLRNPLN